MWLLKFWVVWGIQAFMLSGLVSCSSLLTRTPEPEFKVVLQDNEFSVREYESYMLVSREVEGPADDAPNRAFRDLFRYISGDNLGQKEISMTAPVLQREARGLQISMTVPVVQKPLLDNRQVVSFVLPKEFHRGNSPQPTNSKLTLTEVPVRKVAVLRYTGSSRYSRYQREQARLEAWVSQKGFRTLGSPERAQYNPPWTPWFLRRNEVMIPVGP